MRKQIRYPKKDGQRLLRLARERYTAYRVVLRTRIVLAMMAGLKKKEIAEKLGTSRPTVYLWIKRYQEKGIEAILKDVSRPGRLPNITEEKEKEIVEATLNTLPKEATHWSVRLMAKIRANVCIAPSILTDEKRTKYPIVTKIVAGTREKMKHIAYTSLNNPYHIRCQSLITLLPNLFGLNFCFKNSNFNLPLAKHCIIYRSSSAISLQA